MPFWLWRCCPIKFESILRRHCFFFMNCCLRVHSFVMSFLFSLERLGPDEEAIQWCLHGECISTPSVSHFTPLQVWRHWEWPGISRFALKRRVIFSNHNGFPYCPVIHCCCEASGSKACGSKACVALLAHWCRLTHAFLDFSFHTLTLYVFYSGTMGGDIKPH